MIALTGFEWSFECGFSQILPLWLIKHTTHVTYYVIETMMPPFKWYTLHKAQAKCQVIGEIPIFQLIIKLLFHYSNNLTIFDLIQNIGLKCDWLKCFVLWELRSNQIVRKRKLIHWIIWVKYRFQLIDVQTFNATSYTN